MVVAENGRVIKLEEVIGKTPEEIDELAVQAEREGGQGGDDRFYVPGFYVETPIKFFERTKDEEGLLLIARGEEFERGDRIRAWLKVIEICQQRADAEKLLGILRGNECFVKGNVLTALMEVHGQDVAALGVAAGEEQNPLEYRLKACEKLGILGEKDKAVPILLAIARNDKNHVSYRLEACALLGANRETSEIAPILLAIARNDENGPRCRLGACRAAVKAGQEISPEVMQGIEAILKNIVEEYVKDAEILNTALILLVEIFEKRRDSGNLGVIINHQLTGKKPLDAAKAALGRLAQQPN